MIRNIIVCLVVGISAMIAGHAQENLSNTITIDRIIVPEERAATRMAVNPVLLPAKVKDVRLDFMEYLSASDLTRSILFTQPYPWGDSIEPSPFRGRATLGYLPEYNLIAGVAWRAVDTEPTLLNISAAFDGHRHTWSEDMPTSTGSDRINNFVRENSATVSAALLHRISAGSFLTAEAAFTYFNGACSTPSVAFDPSVGGIRNTFRQSADILDIKAGYTGHYDAGIAFDTSLHGGIFGFGEARYDAADGLPAVREVNYGAAAGIRYTVDESSELALDVAADFYSYNHRGTVFGVSQNEKGEYMHYFAGGSGITRMLASVSPAYRIRRGALSAILALKLDISTNSQGILRFSPDVTVSYVPTSAVAVYAKVSGGEHSNSFGSLWRISHFFDSSFVYDNSTLALRAEAGINIGKINGFTAGLSIVYASADDWLLPAVIPGYANYFRYCDVKSWLAGVQLAYDYHGVAGAYMSYHVVPSADKHIYYQWRDRAESVAEAGVWLKPLKRLEVNVDFEYRAGRSIFCSSIESAPLTVSLRDVANLKLKATYDISKRLNAFMELDNLLCHKYYDCFLLGAQRFGGHVGVSYSF